MKPSPLRRKRRKRPPKGIGRISVDIEAQLQRDWKQVILLLLGGRCAVPKCPRPALDPHHVVYRRHLEDLGLFPWDVRDGLPLCRPCHDGHHYGVTGTLSMMVLTDVNLDYAFEVLGAYAYDYLRRRYRGDDPRLEARLAAAEKPEAA